MGAGEGGGAGVSSAAGFEDAAAAATEFASLVRAQIADDEAGDLGNTARAVDMWNTVYGPHIVSGRGLAGVREAAARRWARDLEAASGLAVQLAQTVARWEGGTAIAAVERAEAEVVSMYRRAAEAAPPEPDAH